MTKREAAELIPKKPTQQKLNLERCVFMHIAPVKWGKTEFWMSNPNAVLFACEEGHKFQSGHKMIIDKWDSKKRYDTWTDNEDCPHMTFMQGVEALETIQKFSLVIVDTAVMAARMCSDYHLERRGLEHMADEQWGKAYDTCLNTPFRQAILRLLKTGRGVVLLCHSKIEIAKFSKGEVARKESNLPGGVKAFAESQADLIMHGELGKKRGDNNYRDRIMVLHGDQDIQAGTRAPFQLPERYVVNRHEQWAQLKAIFSDPAQALKEERRFVKLYKK